MNTTTGLHHVTAVASDPAQNVSFYQEVLGLRLVKRTVNFDDPGTWHLYYGDNMGSPGTVLTFFPWPHMKRGRVGAGETSAVAYLIPVTSIEYWEKRLGALVESGFHKTQRFGNTVLQFSDPDGMVLELEAVVTAPEIDHYVAGEIPLEHAVRGFAHVTLNVVNPDLTAAILTDHLGYRLVGSESARSRYAVPGDGPGHFIDVLAASGPGRGSFGAGSVHHVAFRASDDGEQGAMSRSLVDRGMRVTAVQDRQYFRSVYFREPSGVLFEIATDRPGFLIDEEQADLGSVLKLPAWLESKRAQIEATLPRI